MNFDAQVVKRMLKFNYLSGAEGAIRRNVDSLLQNSMQLELDDKLTVTIRNEFLIVKLVFRMICHKRNWTNLKWYWYIYRVMIKKKNLKILSMDQIKSGSS